MCLIAVRGSMRTRFADTAQHADAFFVIRATSSSHVPTNGLKLAKNVFLGGRPNFLAGYPPKCNRDS